MALPPAPAVNRDVPVITSAGGSSAAYKDPNSPESIMRKVTLTQAQSITDTRFDVPADAFTNFVPETSLWLLTMGVIAILLVLLATQKVKGTMRSVLYSAVVLLLVLSIALKKKNE